MGTVRAKFKCLSVKKTVHWNATDKFLFTAYFQPVTTGSEENKKFFDATPSGNLEIGTFSEEYFLPGKEYYIDFTPAG